MAIKESLEKFEKVIAERDVKHSEFVRNILVIASGALGILASLHKTQASSLEARILFDVTMICLALGILAGACTLYRHVHSSQKLYEGVRDAIIKQIQTNSEKFESVTGNPPQIFAYAEKLCYLSLCLAVISLCGYAIAVC